MSKKTFLGKKKCEMSHWESIPLHSEYRMKILVRFLDFKEKEKKSSGPLEKRNVWLERERKWDYHQTYF